MRISDVLASKGSASVHTISAQATLQELVDLLVEHRIGAAVVSDDGEHVLGIISERDVVRVLAGGQSALDSQVGEAMTVDVTVCEPEDSIEDLMRAMTDRRIRHIPVVRNGHLAGMVSIGDAVKARMSALEFERDQLNTYVRGG